MTINGGEGYSSQTSAQGGAGGAESPPYSEIVTDDREEATRRINGWEMGYLTNVCDPILQILGFNDSLLNTMKKQLSSYAENVTHGYTTYRPPFHWIATLAGIMGIAAFYQYKWLMPLY